LRMRTGTLKNMLSKKYNMYYNSYIRKKNRTIQW
jgi:hypothetical protein